MVYCDADAAVRRIMQLYYSECEESTLTQKNRSPRANSCFSIFLHEYNTQYIGEKCDFIYLFIFSYFVVSVSTDFPLYNIIRNGDRAFHVEREAQSQQKEIRASVSTRMARE